MTFTKDPDAALDYTVDWARWLAGDTIAASAWLVPVGLVTGGKTNTASNATVWLSGGAAGLSYTVTNRITTAGGRTEDRSFIVRVEDR